MSYLVLARKYRPQTFTEILGQEPIVTTLSNAIKKKRIGQAYLFAGPRGTGKTSTARIFAKALNCSEGPTATPCLKCQACEEVAEGRSLDVLEIDGASNRGIDQIRALRELAKFSPAGGAYKIYIIDEVHQITSEGFNALLKTLEEPPAHVLFILATTAAHKMPATILSRCQRFEFKRLPVQLIADKLKQVAADERLSASPEALLGIARAAGGSLRDAESILDQAAAFAGGKIKPEDVQVLLGAMDEDLFAEALRAVREAKPVELLRVVAEITDAGADLVQWTLGLLGFVRNLLVARVGGGALGFEHLEKESVKRLEELAGQFSLEELAAIAQGLSGAAEAMRWAGDPRIPLEMALVRLSSPGGVVSVAELVDRLERMEQRLRGGPTPPLAGGRVKEEASSLRAVSVPLGGIDHPVPHTEAPGARQGERPQAQAASIPPELERVISAWPSLLAGLHNEKAATAAYLAEAYPVALQAGDPPALQVGLPEGCEFHRDSLESLATKQLIEKSLGALLGHPVRCEFRIVKALPARSAPAEPEPAPPEAAGPPAAFLNSVTELFEGRMLPGEG